MTEGIVLKRDGQKIIKKRLQNLLKPYGFQPYPHSATRLVRIREEFIDELAIVADMFGFKISSYIYLRHAPIVTLECLQARLFKVARERGEISTQLFWHCEIPEEGPWYYPAEQFEAIWQDETFMLKQYVLPQIDEMSIEKFLSRLQKRDNNDIFWAEYTVSFKSTTSISAANAALAYGIGLLQLDQSEEAVSYFVFARQVYKSLITKAMQDDAPFGEMLCKLLTLVENLLSLKESNEKEWAVLAKICIEQIAADWASYMQ